MQVLTADFRSRLLLGGTVSHFPFCVHIEGDLRSKLLLGCLSLFRFLSLRSLCLVPLDGSVRSGCARCVNGG